MIVQCRRLRHTAFFFVLTFISSIISPAVPTLAQAQSINLPAPGTILPQSQPFTPPLIKALTIDPNDALRFEFIIDSGDSKIDDETLKKEADKLIKYFMAALTVPAEELWVNLSPYEEDRIIPSDLGYTELGKDLLSQDYILKQLTASFMYPEDKVGQEFWQRVQDRAKELFGGREVPMNTFNKIWIVPDEALILERDNNAIVIDSHLKVLLEEDYLALKENLETERFGTGSIKEDEAKAINAITSDVVREILLPEIEREVNEGENFANLRQIYNAMILATWYKQNLKESLLSQVYVDKNRIAGIDIEDRKVKEKIFAQYIKAFQQGAYDYTKDEINFETLTVEPKRYYSGGLGFKPAVVQQGTIQRDQPIPVAVQSRVDTSMKTSGETTRFRVVLNQQRENKDKTNITMNPDVTIPAILKMRNSPTFESIVSDRLKIRGVNDIETKTVSDAIKSANPSLFSGDEREIVDIVRASGVSDRTVIAVEDSLSQIAEDSYRLASPSAQLNRLATGVRFDAPSTRAAYSSELREAGINANTINRAVDITQSFVSNPQIELSPVRHEAALIQGGLSLADARTVSRVTGLMSETRLNQFTRDQFDSGVSGMRVLAAANEPVFREITTAALDTLDLPANELQQARQELPGIIETVRGSSTLAQVQRGLESRGMTAALASRLSQPDFVDQIVETAQNDNRFAEVDVRMAGDLYRATLNPEISQPAMSSAFFNAARFDIEPLTEQEADIGARAVINVMGRDPSSFRQGFNAQSLADAVVSDIRTTRAADAEVGRKIASVIVQPQALTSLRASIADRSTFEPVVASMVEQAARNPVSLEKDLRAGFEAAGRSQATIDRVVPAVVNIAQRAAAGDQGARDALRSMDSLEIGLREIGGLPADVAREGSGIEAVRNFESVSRSRSRSESTLNIVPVRAASNPEVFRNSFDGLVTEVNNQMREPQNRLSMDEMNSLRLGIERLALESPVDSFSSEQNFNRDLRKPELKIPEKVIRYAETNRIALRLGDLSRKRGMALKDTDLGGIDLNMSLLNLAVRQEGAGVQMVIAQGTIDPLNLDGFEPVITDMSNVKDFQQELGLDNM